MWGFFLAGEWKSILSLSHWYMLRFAFRYLMPRAEGFAEDLNCVKKEKVFCIVVLMQAGRTKTVHSSFKTRSTSHKGAVDNAKL